LTVLQVVSGHLTACYAVIMHYALVPID